MKRFVRYFCFYCLSRLAFDVARAGFNHQHTAPAAPCKKHAKGIALGIVSLPFIGAAVLTAIGFLTK